MIGSVENLSSVWLNSRFIFVEGNVCNRELVDSLFRKYNVVSVIHFTAETHVDNSIRDPSIFVKT